MQCEPDLIQEVIHLLRSHGLEVMSVDLEEGQIVVRIPKV